MVKPISFHFLLAALVAPLALALVSPPSPAEAAKRATCTVNSAAAVKSISSCSSVVINAFTIPSGTTIDMKFAKGATVTMNGDITFAKTTASGPLITLEGSGVTFNGNGHKLDGNGALYWDGHGTSNSGVAKPHPLVQVKMDGTLENLTVLNSPAHAISVANKAALTIQGVTVDNSAGDYSALGYNTDGFDVSANDVTIKNCVVKNQDDCIAINSGSNIILQNNQCYSGHGISIGSISSGMTVSGVTISGNTVTNSMYGLRIKVQAAATSGSVSSVTYSGNTVSGISKYGILITQSYPADFGSPGTTTTISDISFIGATTSVSVNSGAAHVGVDCGHCKGTWDWSSLKATGGTGNKLVLAGAAISSGSY